MKKTWCRKSRVRLPLRRFQYSKYGIIYYTAGLLKLFPYNSFITWPKKCRIIQKCSNEYRGKLKPVCTAVVAYSWSYAVFGQPLRCGRPHSWIWNDIGRNCWLGHRKKIAKFLMRTFTCRSIFLYGYDDEIVCQLFIIAETPGAEIFLKYRAVWSITYEYADWKQNLLK